MMFLGALLLLQRPGISSPLQRTKGRQRIRQLSGWILSKKLPSKVGNRHLLGSHRSTSWAKPRSLVPSVLWWPPPPRKLLLSHLVIKTSGYRESWVWSSPVPEPQASVAAWKEAPQAGAVGWVLLNDSGRQCAPHCLVTALTSMSAGTLMYPKSPSARGPEQTCQEMLPVSLPLVVARKLNPVPTQPCGLSVSGFWKQ